MALIKFNFFSTSLLMQTEVNVIMPQKDVILNNGEKFLRPWFGFRRWWMECCFGSITFLMRIVYSISHCLFGNQKQKEIAG